MHFFIIQFLCASMVVHWRRSRSRSGWRKKRRWRREDEGEEVEMKGGGERGEGGGGEREVGRKGEG